MNGIGAEKCPGFGRVRRILFTRKRRFKARRCQIEQSHPRRLESVRAGRSDRYPLSTTTHRSPLCSPRLASTTGAVRARPRRSVQRASRSLFRVNNSAPSGGGLFKVRGTRFPSVSPYICACDGTASRSSKAAVSRSASRFGSPRMRRSFDPPEVSTTIMSQIRPFRCRYDATFPKGIRSTSEVHGRKKTPTRFVSMQSFRSVKVGGNTMSVTLPPNSCAHRLP